MKSGQRKAHSKKPPVKQPQAKGNGTDAPTAPAPIEQAKPNMTIYGIDGDLLQQTVNMLAMQQMDFNNSVLRNNLVIRLQQLPEVKVSDDKT